MYSLSVLARPYLQAKPELLTQDRFIFNFVTRDGEYYSPCIIATYDEPLAWLAVGREVRNTVVFLLHTMSCSKPAMALYWLITDALGVMNFLWQVFCQGNCNKTKWLCFATNNFQPNVEMAKVCHAELFVSKEVECVLSWISESFLQLSGFKWWALWRLLCEKYHSWLDWHMNDRFLWWERKVLHCKRCLTNSDRPSFQQPALESFAFVKDNGKWAAFLLLHAESWVSGHSRGLSVKNLLWFFIKPVRTDTSLSWPDSSGFWVHWSIHSGRLVQHQPDVQDSGGLLCELHLSRSGWLCLSLSHLVWLAHAVRQATSVTAMVNNLSQTRLSTVEHGLQRWTTSTCPTNFHASLGAV